MIAWSPDGISDFGISAGELFKTTCSRHDHIGGADLLTIGNFGSTKVVQGVYGII